MKSSGNSPSLIWSTEEAPKMLYLLGQMFCSAEGPRQNKKQLAGARAGDGSY
jgi:hypothetical protein